MADERFSDNAELIIEAQKGDKDALAKLTENNMGLVRSIAVRFIGRGVELEDLIQIGTIGMLKAIKSFDTSFGTVFSTYAVPLIIGEIKRYLRDDGIIRVGRKIKRMGAEILKAREEYISEHGFEPTLDELAKICQVDREELVFALDSTNQVASLSEVMGDTGLTLESTIADTDDKIGVLTEHIALTSALGKLCPQSRKIIYLRYFKNKTQQECAEILGLTQVKVSREEKKILAALKQQIGM